MTTNDKPTIVLVHGLWADGSCWSGIIGPLQADGYNVISVQNPLSTLKDDVAAVQRVLDLVDGPVILVGHSWGGFVVTASGNDARVKGLVYVAAFAPDTGDSLSSLGDNFSPPDLYQHLVIKDDYVWLSRDGVTSFASDLPKADQDFLYATQAPANASLLQVSLEGAPAWKNKPSWYIVAGNDGAINPDLQRFMSQRIGTNTIELATSHVPMLSQPEAVIDLIRQAANSAA